MKHWQQWIRDNEVIHKGDRIVIGVSGGADSVCLLLLLFSLTEEYELSLQVVHVNHGIRGEEAARDEQFVIDLCQQLGVSCGTVHVDVPALASKWSCSEEEAGRLERYRVMEEIRQKLEYDKIAIAHNQNDQAETILHQMCRGCRLSGLTGMAPITGRIIRPLLNVTRDEILEYLELHKVDYMNDSTNDGNDYTRNRIRHKIMPMLETMVHSGASEHIAAMAVELREIEEFMAHSCNELLNQVCVRQKGRITFAIRELKEAPSILQKEAIRSCLYELADKKKDIQAKHIYSVQELMEKATGKVVFLPYGIQARREYDSLVLEVKQMDVMREMEAVTWNAIEINELLPGEERCVKLPDAVLHLSCFENDGQELSIPKNICTKWLDYGKISKSISIRLPREDDYFYMNTEGNRKRLSRYFIDQKYTRQQRKQQIVVAQGNQILWIPGKRGSEAYPVTKDTKQILSLYLQMLE